MNGMDLVSFAVASGLVVLIWMVQLLLYPSFNFYSKQNLVSWHTSYTPRITFIVAPLMLIQLAVAVFRIYIDLRLHYVLFATLVAAAWLVTFFVFIPMHSKIQEGGASDMLMSRLVNLNWSRTLIWSAIFLLECWHLYEIL
ncbi:MAG: hypothetical protein HOI49_04595 [Bacteroidetes bacterium]|jgi:hypothetical protein|nr:hypothetical protein [Bacteroidota bacterium]